MISVEAAAFAAALKRVAPAVGVRSGYAALHGIHLTIADGVMTVAASDLQTTATTTVPCAKGDLECIAPAPTLGGVVAKMGGPVGIDLGKDGLLIVEDAHGGAKLRTLALQDWPRVEPGECDLAELDKRQVDGLRSVLAAAGQPAQAKGSREVLRGVHLDGGCATATDSYRLLSFELGFEVDPVTVPAEPLKAALGDCEKVSIGTTGHQVLVDTGGARWILRVLDGDYPKWRSLTSNPGPIELGFDAETLIDRLARVGALTGSDPLVRLDFADDTLTVSAVDADRGEAVARMDASASAPLRTAMNPVFLRDFASVLGATALVHATGGMHPMIATNDGMTAVVMPRKCGGWTA